MILNGGYKLNKFMLYSMVSKRKIIIEQSTKKYPYLRVDVINTKGDTARQFYINRTRFKRLLDKYEIQEDSTGLHENNPSTMYNVRNGIDAFALNNKAIKENVIKRLERWGYKVEMVPVDKPFIIYTIT